MRNDEGVTVAIVGVDILAPTIRRKLKHVHVALVLSAILTGALVSLVLHFNNRARQALEDNLRLSHHPDHPPRSWMPYARPWTVIGPGMP